ncbi:MAG: helix-turn-helix domain-containing protein [Loktanella sp.]|nr:helix-turn-helix domain-containing protein [Loktanella sp.]
MKVIKAFTPARSRQQRMAKLGTAFEALRLSRNIRQEDLAEQAGIARSTLARLEKKGAATLDTTLRVLQALGLEERLDLLLPEIKESPLDLKSGERQRASGGEAFVLQADRHEVPQVITRNSGGTATSGKRSQKAAKLPAGVVRKTVDGFYVEVTGTHPAGAKAKRAGKLSAGATMNAVGKRLPRTSTNLKRPKWGDER